MKVLKFRTNMVCRQCVNKVKPFLDAEPGIFSWSVDIMVPSKELVVETENLNEQDIVNIVSKAGFKANPRKGNLLDKIFG